MKIHEYQARELLERFGIPVPPAVVVRDAEAAAAAFTALQSQHGCTLAVVKAQVHAGGRGKGGGVKLVRSAAEAKEAAGTILGRPLVTPQTGPEGVEVKTLLVAAGVDIQREFYLGMAIDRALGCPVLIASREGGVDIEQVAKTDPEAIVREPVSPLDGLQPFQARKIAFGLGLSGPAVREAGRIMQNLCDLFVSTDASLAEINPLVLTKASDSSPGEVLAIDAKISFDDNGLFRHEDLRALADPDEEDPAEARAKKHGLSYIKLDGTIGCLVNGAGLAMATMDLIKLHGAEPANFLDVGGSADDAAVTEAFRIVLEDANVRGVLVNIFGGIAKCDTIARAIVAAARDVGFRIPLVVRLEGTNVQVARELLAKARKDLPTLITADDLTDAARKITSATAA